MLYLIIAIIVQLLLVAHVIKTGKNKTWLGAFVLLPLVSGVAYIFIEIVPNIIKTKRSTATGREYEHIVNADFSEHVPMLDVNSNIESDIKDAESHFNKGEYTRAKTRFEQLATGNHHHNPLLMFGAARCSFSLREFEQTKSILDELIHHNPDYKNPEAHLRYARTLAEMNDAKAAIHEFETLHQYFTGPKASFYFAQFLKRQGQTDKANAIFSAILEKANASGEHYDLIYYNIIQQVKDELDEA